MNIAIILSGGVGSRMGLDIPKQYVLVKDRPVISYCLDTLLKNNKIEMVVIGVADVWQSFVQEQVALLGSCKKVVYAKPGETRQFSIYNALIVAEANGAGSGDCVIIHDAARPLVSSSLIDSCLDGCANADGVMPVVPCKDTVYYSENGVEIDSLLNRNYLWCGQAPEAFNFSKYLEAHKKISKEELLKVNGSTELAVKANLKCRMIPGDVMNFKITTPEDLSNFENIVGK